MVVVSYSGKEINAKLVYYGAGLSGKTTNLESIYEAVPDTSRGKMVSMKTQSDRTLFFDLLPLDLGEIMGFKTRFLLYTVPGQVFYNATRKLVLKGADAIVFVADSEVGKMDENQESLANLKANLNEYGLRLDEIPWVIQYNKRDLPRVYTVDELNAALNPGGSVPFFEAVATQGTGVFETFRGISHLLMEKVTRELRRGPATAAGHGRGSSKTEGAPAPSATPSLLDAPIAARPIAAEPPAAAPVGPGAPAVPATPAPAPAASAESQAPFHFGRELTLGDAQSSASDGSPSHARAAVRSAPVADDASEGTGDAVTAVSTSSSTPERPAMSHPARAEVEVHAQGAAAGSPESSQELVVPITLSSSGQHEIVLRIIVSTR